MQAHRCVVDAAPIPRRLARHWCLALNAVVLTRDLPPRRCASYDLLVLVDTHSHLKGAVMTQRINYMEQSPELTKKFMEFSHQLSKGSIDQSIIDLVSIRASQINGCTFCIDMHVKEAKIHGERELRLYHLAG